MKQIVQFLNNGKVEVIQIPKPIINNNKILVRSCKSLISSGTEKMLLEFGKSNLISKVLREPEKAKLVLSKIAKEGVLSTYNTVNDKLKKPISIGYCNVGRIEFSPFGQFNIGDRVISNGPHAEYFNVSKNLCAHVPDNVSDETAVFTVLASVGLQGIRLVKPTLGETIVVIGLGLIGLLTVQILVANGNNVIGIDTNDDRLKLAKKYGVTTINANKNKEILDLCFEKTNGHGVDAVIITAATKSNTPISMSSKICRQRGRVVLVGVVGLNLDRAEFYKKEITFQVSCSYGPGRYDQNYENLGLDYPVGFVRWTEQRNFETILQLMKNGKINVSNLITHYFDIKDGDKGIKLLDKKVNHLGIIINYPNKNTTFNKNEKIKLNIENKNITVPNIGFIGAGNYASKYLIPALTKTKATLNTIISSNGITSHSNGLKFGFSSISNNSKDIFLNKNINCVFIASRHDSHASYVLEALKFNKNVFCEKPLCINMKELEEIKNNKIKKDKVSLMVGFNRRFSPLVKIICNLLKTVHNPKNFVLTVNAGFIEQDNWIQNMEEGGGRVIGEVCHFIDLLMFLSKSKIVGSKVNVLKNQINTPIINDNLTISLNFEDGSLGVINYFSNGHKMYQKEKLEIFSGGKVLLLEDYKSLKAWGFSNFNKKSLFFQDKGQIECTKLFINSLKKGIDLINFNEIYDVSKNSIIISEKIRNFTIVD